MKARTTTSLLALVTLLAASCAKDGGKSQPVSVPRPQEASISVQASVRELTKATTEGLLTSFAAEDQLTLYAWTGSATEVPATRVVDGVVNTYDGTTWTPASTMLWKNVTDAHYFLGIFPARTVESFTADPVSSSVDLLVATVLGDGITAPQTTTAEPVDLVFDHMMARLNINVKYRNQWGGVPEAVVTADAAPSGKIDYLTKTITPGSKTGQGLAATTAAEGYSATYTSLCIPQAINTVRFTIDGQKLVYTHGEDITLEAGEVTTLSLLVGKDKIVLDDNTVSDWDDEGTVEGEDDTLPDLLANATRPLTLKAKENGTTVSFSNKSAGTVTWITSDGRTGTIAAGSSKDIPLAVGQRVWFLGDGTNKAFSDGTEIGSSHIGMDKPAEVYGNVMSLLGGDFATNTTLSGAYTFAGLFKDQTKLKNSSEEEGLYLPATTLTENCYKEMFRGCTGLEQIVTATPKNWAMGQDIPWGMTVYEPGADGTVKVFTTPTALTTALTYNTAAQTLVTAGVAHKDGVELEYSTNGTTWTSTVSTGTNAGNYNVYCRVKDGGVSSAALPVTIAPKVVTSPTITLSPASYTYDGTAKKPTATVKDGNNVIPDSEYTVMYSSNTNAGTAKVTIEDKTGGNYTVSGSTTFTINKAAGSISYATTTVNKPSGASFNNATLTNTGDGRVTYSSSNTNVATVNSSTGAVSVVKNISGTTTITITATVTDGSNYTYATKTATYSLTVVAPTTFSYTGNVQSWKAPVAGKYKLEVWGAQGGNRVGDQGGKGGYATGQVTLDANTTLYITVGGQGGSKTAYEGEQAAAAGGYNGGGKGGVGNGQYSGSGGGGGATHIAKSSFVIGSGATTTYDGKDFLIVAGGGGGRGHGASTPGVGGGTGNAGNTSWDAATWTGALGTKVSGKTGDNYNAPVTYCNNQYWPNADTKYSYGRDGFNGVAGDSSAEGSGGGGAGYWGGDTYQLSSGNFKSASGCGGISNYNSAQGVIEGSYSATAGQRSGNGQAKITFIE